MTTYLAIITTALVITQIIRLAQNTISLTWQNREIKRQISWIKDVELSEKDFEIQRAVYELLYEELQGEKDNDRT